MLPHGRRPGDSHDKTDEMAMCRHDELQLQEAVDGVEAVGVACPEVHQQTKLPQQLADSMEWTDEHTSIVCELFAEQVGKGNRPNTHLNAVGYAEVAQFFWQRTTIELNKLQLKNKWDKLKVDLTIWQKLMRRQTGTGWDHLKKTIEMDPEWWKLMRAVMEPIVVDEDAVDNIHFDEEYLAGADEVEEISPSINSTKKRAHVGLGSAQKKNKSSLALVIQEKVAQIADSTKAIASRKLAEVTIKEIMDMVVACCASCGSDEHCIATELFVKKEQRDMFLTLPTNEIKFNWLHRKFKDKFSK
ncbi:hypothetical protein U9M48_005534 [Paspalum notatum var. saurae]|uniref:Myb/SANT-like domain-containing protein n=1 Tax=Paspalum notatum var. saurae TaxID=547442 RepID=A0AAQ3PQC7_PASNO